VILRVRRFFYSKILLLLLVLFREVALFARAADGVFCAVDEGASLRY